MFRPISGYCQVQSWYWNLIKEEISIYSDWRRHCDNFGTAKEAKSVNSIVTAVVEPLSICVVPVYEDKNSKNFNCILCTCIMYIP
jgi:hypothetical protein